MARETRGRRVAGDSADDGESSPLPTASAGAASKTIALLAARVVGALASTFVLAYSAHQLSIGDFGLVASVLAGGFIVNAMVSFGTDTIVTRSVARGDGSEASDSLRFQLGVSTAAVAVAGLGVVTWSWPTAVLVQAVVLLPMAVITVAGAVLRGLQLMVPLAVSAVVGGVVSVIAVVVGFEVVEARSTPLVALGLGAAVTATIQSMAVVRSRLETAATASSGGVRSLLRRSAPFAAMIVVAAVGTQGGLLIVEAMSDTPTGGYGAAIRVVEAGRLVPASAMAAWFPMLVAGSVGSDYRVWSRGLIAYSIVAALAVVVLAPMIDRVVFDSQPDGVALLRVLAVGLPITTMRLLRSTEAIATDRERLVLVSAVAGTAVLLVGGVIGAVVVGAVGVAVAQVGGVAASTVVLLSAGRSSAAAA